MKQQIKRVTLTGESFNEISFDNLCGKYMVKNFSLNDIYVSFDAGATVNNSSKIKGGFYQIVIANELLGGIDEFKTKKIYIKGNGEVEVQQLCFR